MASTAVTRVVAIALLLGLAGAPLVAGVYSTWVHGLFLEYVFPFIIHVFHLSAVCR
jgi:hypothetical protein